MFEVLLRGLVIFTYIQYKVDYLDITFKYCSVIFLFVIIYKLFFLQNEQIKVKPFFFLFSNGENQILKGI